MIFYFRTQLINKQEKLEAMLLEMTTEASQLSYDDETQVEMIIEEHLEIDEETTDEMYEELSDNDGGDELVDENEVEIVEVVSLPSVKHLSCTDNKSIIDLINEIEEKNELILQCSTPPAKKRKIQSTTGKSKSHQVTLQPAPRKEELKFEKLKPKIVLQPTTSPSLFSPQENLQKRSPKPLEDPITCCEQVFNFKSEYRKHQFKVHPSSPQCSFCGKILKSKKTLIIHNKSHQDYADRRFKCSFDGCGKAFNFKLHLDNHERTHSGKPKMPLVVQTLLNINFLGERPFKCTICPASFKQSFQLTIHMRKHTEVTNKCSKCDQLFTGKTQLNKHKKSCVVPETKLRETSPESSN